MTLAVHQQPETREGWSLGEACKRLEDAGADVVGLNCIRGPATMLPLLDEIRAAVDGHVAALPGPVPHHTTSSRPSSRCAIRTTPTRPAGARSRPRSTRSPATGTRSPTSRARPTSSASATSASAAAPAPHHIRSMAEALGRTPPGSRYTADMSKHAFLGTDPSLREDYRGYAGEL